MIGAGLEQGWSRVGTGVGAAGLGRGWSKVEVGLEQGWRRVGVWWEQQGWSRVEGGGCISDECTLIFILL